MSFWTSFTSSFVITTANKLGCPHFQISVTRATSNIYSHTFSWVYVYLLGFCYLDFFIILYYPIFMGFLWSVSAITFFFHLLDVDSAFNVVSWFFFIQNVHLKDFQQKVIILKIEGFPQYVIFFFNSTIYFCYALFSVLLIWTLFKKNSKNVWLKKVFTSVMADAFLIARFYEGLG